MKAVVAAYNQEKALVGAFSVITNLRMELFEALMEDPSLHTGRLLNMGDYPNEVRHYAPFLPAIRRMFTFRPRFSARAQSQLRGELARRGLASEEVTWVGVHNRRSSGAPHIPS